MGWHCFVEEQNQRFGRTNDNRSAAQLKAVNRHEEFLEATIAENRQRLARTSRRAELGVLGGFSMDAQAETSRDVFRKAQRQRMEEQLAALRTRQAAAEEAARK